MRPDSEPTTTPHASTGVPRWIADPPPGPDAPAEHTGVHGVRLPAELARAVRRAARELGTTLPALLLAAHARVLATVAAERELLIGYVPPAPAPEEAPERPLRLTVAPATWRALVDAAAEAAATAHRAGTPPEVVLDLSGLAPGGELRRGDGVVLRAAWSRDEEGGLALRLLHDPAAVDAAYAERLAGYHLTALRLLVADPHARHDRQSLLSAREVETQLYGLAGPRVPLPEATFPELFAEQARRTPDAVAAEHGARRWTYRQLDEQARRVADALRAAGAAGAGGEDVVAVVMDRSLEWIAAAIGTLKAGCVYLPIAPDLPASRVNDHLERAGAAYVLGAPPPDPRWEECGPPAAAGSVHVLRTWRRTPTPPGVWASGGGAPDRGERAAYIYFTSGSSGEPKGVLCEHAGLLNHLHAKIADMGLAPGPGEVVAQTASPGFDISLWQFAAPLLTGAAVRVIDTDAQLDVAAFLDEIVTGRVTVAQLVPSYLEVLLTHLERHPRGPGGLGALRAVSVTGEALSHELVQRWFAACPGIALVNAYGATEVCDDTTHHVLHAPPARGPVPLGRSLNNVNAYVLDENLQLVPLGSVGEIAFSGVCVARGYVNDEERTRQVFVPDPFRAGARLYRTGDFGRWLPDGRLEFRGRHDEQVKIRGFRIEIGEIENRLLAVPGVREAAVVIDRGAAEPGMTGGTTSNLVAFFGADGADGAGPPGERAREVLAERLPDYMVPAYVHRLARLPHTENGKIDKRALVRLAGTLGHGGVAAHAAPGTPAEQRLAMVWAEVLGVPLERIGRTDSFFALGGTSLAAVRLLVHLDGALSLRDLLAHPVLADLATALDGGPGGDRGGDRGEAGARLLQPLSSPRNPHHTLVCFPYAGGNAVNFRSLAAELEGDGIAVLAVEPPGHDFAGAAEPLRDVPWIARRVRQEIQDGVTTPVLIWGHCAGAAPALATARLLQEAGWPAERVFLGGALLPDAEDLRAESAEVAAAGNADLLGRLREDSAYVELDAFQPERAEVAGRAYRHDVLTANRHLLRLRQDAGPYRLDAPIEAVVARDDATTARAAERYGDWKALSDRVSLRELDQGGHYFVTTRPAEAAEAVRAACVTAAAPPPPP
ncbi:amino acid adenylation domain-containing protein [Streptomyces sp. 6N223]|uniref:amino acid adenylation domain-containing protein n=1 Tax=Streptomyces sp. 6N223 TaxID=3457412 RepID=UPI003FD69429